MGLRSGSRLYFDTNVVIWLIEKKDNIVLEALKALRVSGGTVVTSELTLAEALVLPIEEGDLAAIETYENFVTTGDGVVVVAVDRDVLRQSAGLRARLKGLKTPDSIHVASALLAKCDLIVTGDLRLTTPDGLEVIRPEDFAAWNATA